MIKKIIELEIDENILTGDTGADTVAWVEEPAIDTQFVFFGRQKFYKAPDYVADKACQAIKENEKRGNPAGTQVGKVRAQQLCGQSEISLETIKRMKSFLERAATYNTGNWDDNGTIAYGLWGGEEALKWVDTVLSQLENQEMDIDVSNLPQYENYPTGDTKDNMLVKPIDFVQKIDGESKDDYLQRCIPVLRSEGYEQDQAVAICISEYENFSKCGKCKQSKEKMDMTPNPCWEGYEPYGTKIVDGKEVPNCVPIENSKQNFELLGYMDGIPYFSTPEEAIEYGQENYNCEGYHVHTDEDGNEVYMSCATHDELMSDYGTELEDLLNEGWEITEVKEVNPEEVLKRVKDKYSKVTEEKFYKIMSDPNENSILDFAGSKIRYVYVSGMGPDLMKTSREFCRRMMGGKQYVFRYEDIMRLNAQISVEDDGRTIIPRPEGTQPDIMLYKGGANCRHYWLELIFGNMTPGVGYEETITNRKYDEIRKAVINTPATGQAGQVNPKANPQKGARDGFNKGVNRAIIVDVENGLFDRVVTPNKKVIDYINSKWSGHRIIVVSDRSPGRLIETRGLLERNLVRFDELYLTGSPDGKVKKVRELINKGIRVVEAIEFNPFIATQYRGLGIMKVVSPRNFNKINDELVPTGYIQGLPVFEDEVDARDYSYLNGCGGIVEEVEYLNKKMYQSCSYNVKKEEQYDKVIFSKDNDKRMVYGPLMLPNVLIPRLDEDTGEKYYVKFKPETIEKIQRKFMINGYQRSTNYEHEEDIRFNDAVLVENWIVTSENDKIYDMGFTKLQIPIGSWVGGYYILPTKEGDKIWEMVKKGKVKGFSIEGFFNLKFNKITKDDILLQQIIEILDSVQD